MDDLTERAKPVASDSRHITNPIARGSVADFVLSLCQARGRGKHRVGAFPVKSVARDDVEDAFLSCSRSDWERRFGPPINVLDHGGALAHLEIQTWDQPCTDGNVVCVGHLCRGRAGASWVVLVRTCTADPSRA
jgi:hypothetical protein